MSDPMLEEQIREATSVFAADEGVWDAEMEIFPAPGVPPIHQRGVSTNRLIAGGRWLVVDFVGDTGFAGHGIYGFDASTGKYTGAWVDSMQTAISRGTGSWDASTKTMTFDIEVTHGDQTVRYREITVKTDPEIHVYRNLVPLPGGGEFEMIKATYRKRR